MAGNLQRTVMVEDSGAGGSRLGVVIEEIGQSLQCAGCHKGIGIKQKDILPRTSLNGLIVRARKTHIFAIFDEMHWGESLAHHPGAIIAGGVIDYPDLKGRSWRICQDGNKAIF